MDFRDYTYVQAIARYGNISRAAEALYISQPSLSKFLQKLEDQIGTPLFERISKRMLPTYAGEQFLSTGCEIFRLQSRLDHTLAQVARKTVGRLSVASTSTRGYYVLPEVLPRFKIQYPGYHIELLERNVDEVERALGDGSADLAVYALTERNPEFTYFHINTEEVVLCLAADSPYIRYSKLREGFKYPWLDLSFLDGEVFFLNDSVQWRIGRISRQLLIEAHINPELTVLRSLETCLALASRGLGFTFSFDICISCFKNCPQPPVYLSVGNRPNQAEFVVACRKNHRLQQADIDFINLIRQRFCPAGIPQEEGLPV